VPPVTTYFLTVTAHVLAALVWLGGMIFFAVAAPILRGLEDEAVRSRLFTLLGERLRTVGWVCITILVLTGVLQMRTRGWWGPAVWGEPAFWGSAVGAALGAKLALVALMIAAQAVHDFWLGPSAGRAEPGSGRARSLRRTAAWLARGNTALGLVLVYFAVRLARGG